MGLRTAFIVSAGIVLGTGQIEAATFDLIFTPPVTNPPRPGVLPRYTGSFTVPDNLLGPAHANGFINFTQITFDAVIDGIRFNLPGDVPTSPDAGLRLDANGQPYAFAREKITKTSIYDSYQPPQGLRAHLSFTLPSTSSGLGRWDYSNSNSPLKTITNGRFEIGKPCTSGNASVALSSVCLPGLILPKYNNNRYCKGKDKVIVGSVIQEFSGGAAFRSFCPECLQLAALIHLSPDKVNRDKLANIVRSKLDNEEEIAFIQIYGDQRWQSSRRGALAEIGAQVLSSILKVPVGKLLPRRNKPSDKLKQYMDWYLEEIVTNYITQPAIKALIERPCQLNAQDVAQAVFRYVHQKNQMCTSKRNVIGFC